MNTKRIPRHTWMTLSFVWAAVLAPRSASAFQQGAPTPSRELSIRTSVDVEMLAEEQYRLGLAYLKSPESTERAVLRLKRHRHPVRARL